MSAASEADLLGSIERGEAPRRILEFAARGFVPLPPGELVRAVGTIVATGDAELKEIALETFRTFDELALREAIASQAVRTEQLAVIAENTEQPQVLENLIRHRNVSDETLAWLAERIGPWLQDVLITNQVRLLRAPVIVERLFENPQLSADIRRRADEFVEEFFLKKIREEEERAAAEAAAANAAAQAADLPVTSFDEEEEISAADVAKLAAAADGDLEGEYAGNLAKLSLLTVMERIRIAYRGSREERLFLARDNNRLVSMAVLRSPKTRDRDVEIIATMRNIPEEVLRVVGLSRMWTRKYPILSALVKNPRTPIDVSLPLMNRVLPKDIKLLAKDRNVPEAVRNFARRAAARQDA
jgi:hypothetical protein